MSLIEASSERRRGPSARWQPVRASAVRHQPGARLSLAAGRGRGRAGSGVALEMLLGSSGSRH